MTPLSSSEQNASGAPRCSACGAALAAWDEIHTVDDCHEYGRLSPADQGAYEEAVEIIRRDRGLDV